MAGDQDWSVGPTTSTKDWGADDTGDWGNTEPKVVANFCEYSGNNLFHRENFVDYSLVPLMDTTASNFTGIPCSRKLLREKTFTNFVVLWLYTRVFFVKFGVWHPLVRQTEQSRKIFSVKIIFFT